MLSMFITILYNIISMILIIEIPLKISLFCIFHNTGILYFCTILVFYIFAQYQYFIFLHNTSILYLSMYANLILHCDVDINITL